MSAVAILNFGKNVNNSGLDKDILHQIIIHTWCILGGASALYVATAQESEAEEEGRERALVQI